MQDWEDLSRAEHWDQGPPGYRGPRPSKPSSVRTLTIVAGIPVAAGAVCWLLVLASFLPGAPWFGLGPVLALLLGIFPFHIATLFVIAAGSGGRFWWSPFAMLRPLKDLPRRVLVAGALAFVAAWLTGLLSMTVGAAGTRHLTDAVTQRVFASIAAAFYAASAMYLLSVRARRKTDSQLDPQ